jgi:hypothetical protein
MPAAAAGRGSTRRGGSRARRADSTMPSAATGRPATTTGAAAEHEPAVISSYVSADPCARTAASSLASRPGSVIVRRVGRSSRRANSAQQGLEILAGAPPDGGAGPPGGLREARPGHRSAPDDHFHQCVGLGEREQFEFG